MIRPRFPSPPGWPGLGLGAWRLGMRLARHGVGLGLGLTLAACALAGGPAKAPVGIGAAPSPAPGAGIAPPGGAGDDGEARTLVVASAPVGEAVGATAAPDPAAPDPASGPRADAPGAAPVAGREDGWLDLPAGRLALSRWPVERPRAVLLALHGYGDYAPTTYEAAARAWAAAGIETFAYDQRGFGRNPSNRRWPGASALVEDLEAAAAAISAMRPGLPLFVAGHSMGGGVALTAAGEGRLRDVRGLVLLAPAVWGGDTLNLLYRASAWGMAAVAPDLRISPAAAPVRILPSDNIPMLIALGRDRLRFANPSPREFMGLIRLMDRAVLAAPGDRIDTLVVMGANDEVVPESSVRRAYDALPGPKSFDYVPTGWHMLLRDLEAGRVHALVADWILARGLPAPPPEAHEAKDPS
ncbi:MAG: alpha/beta fold hydrolase [Pseudomonadota bacterium]|nr:alpha/beta fold hydrolase [Pseudomonadota bacterium]